MQTSNTSDNSHSEKQWYALKVFYNRVFSLEQFIQKDGVESYIPTVVKEIKLAHKIVRRKEPAVSSLMFIRESETYLRQLQEKLKGVSPFMIYYDREAKRPAPISEKDMNAFMLITSSGEQSLEYMADDFADFERGTHVRVIGGKFEGSEGYIHRIKGDKKLIVRIEGVVAVATTYIPGCFLEKI